MLTANPGFPSTTARSMPSLLLVLVGRFRTQRQAIEAAKEHARSDGDWELVIHGRSGRIRDAVAIH
jgi:hypothetical protein